MSFRKARPFLLRESGETVGLDGSPLAETGGARLLVLSRALTRFAFFGTPAGLAGRRAARAARLYADAHAPFTAAGTALSRGPDGYGVWWWDEAQVRALLADRWRYDPDRIIPETLLQLPAADWRLARTADGYEAQYWRSGMLRASVWRRRPFAAQDWQAFGLGVDADERLPALPEPEAVTLVSHPVMIGLTGANRRPDHEWRLATRWLARAAVAAVALAAFFTGQTLRFEARHDRDFAAAEAATATMEGDGTTRQVRAELALVRAFQNRMPASAPLPAVAEAFAILQRFGLQASAWSIDDQAFRARLVTPDDYFALRALATAFEQSPAFQNVAPQLDSERMAITIVADLEPGGAAR